MTISADVEEAELPPVFFLGRRRSRSGVYLLRTPGSMFITYHSPICVYMYTEREREREKERERETMSICVTSRCDRARLKVSRERVGLSSTPLATPRCSRVAMHRTASSIANSSPPNYQFGPLD